jgi:hypothetical protein
MAGHGLPRSIPDIYERLDALETGGGSTVSWADVTDKPATFAPTIGTTATTAKAGNYAPAVATTAVAGIVKMSATQANTAATDVAGLVTDFNALLAKLKAAGLMA